MTRKIQVYDPEDGSVRTYSDQEYLVKFGQEEYDLHLGEHKVIDPADMTPEQREFQRRMQAEADTNAALADACIDSLDDLPHESTQGTPETGPANALARRAIRPPAPRRPGPGGA